MNEIKTPLVSVIIPTYRREESLYKAVTSVCMQTYSNIEIIIVDDNADSQWNSKVFNIIKDYIEDKKVIYVKNDSNMGSAETRNIGIRLAKGKYITFLDDDDIYLTEKIEHQVKYMENLNADYSITDLILYSENDKPEDIRKRDYIKKTDKDSLLKYHLKYHLTGTDTMMFKNEYLNKINLFDKIDVGDEFYLMLKAINQGGVFAYIPVCDVKAYIHTGEAGLSSGRSKIDGENALYEYKKQYFNKLELKTVRYIKMRHHAVLAFAYLRMRKYNLFLYEGLLSFVQSPIACLKVLLIQRAYTNTILK